MSQSSDFIDYYEVLEASPNASTATLERVFRYLAKRFHPDSSDAGDVKKFSLLVEAYETLTDAAARAKYDVDYEKQKAETVELLEETSHLSSDAADRHRLLSLFYAQRRRNMKTPGLGAGSLEHTMNMPEQILGFHLWFFMQKGWIMREESGQLSITADGVEKIEAETKRNDEAAMLKRITQESNRLSPAAAAIVPGAPNTSTPIAL